MWQQFYVYRACTESGSDVASTGDEGKYSAAFKVGCWSVACRSASSYRLAQNLLPIMCARRLLKLK